MCLKSVEYLFWYTAEVKLLRHFPGDTWLFSRKLQGVYVLISVDTVLFSCSLLLKLGSVVQVELEGFVYLSRIAKHL